VLDAVESLFPGGGDMLAIDERRCGVAVVAVNAENRSFGG